MKIQLSELNKDLVYYLACPYTVLNPGSPNIAKEIEHIRFVTITTIGAELTKEGLILITPITVSHILKEYEQSLGTTWDFWKRIDTKLMDKADAMIVAKMQGWDKSIGVTAEITYMKYLQKLIYFLDVDDLNNLTIGDV